MILVQVFKKKINDSFSIKKDNPFKFQDFPRCVLERCLKIKMDD